MGGGEGEAILFRHAEPPEGSNLHPATLTAYSPKVSGQKIERIIFEARRLICMFFANACFVWEDKDEAEHQRDPRMSNQSSRNSPSSSGDYAIILAL